MSDAALAAAVFALDPVGVGGVALRAGPGVEREAWLGALGEMLALRKVPAGVAAERLVGGVDWAGTLASGVVRRERGMLEEGGALVLAMAERVAPGVAAMVAQAMDAGRVGVVLLDEGVGEERAPGCLTERAGLHLSLTEAVEGETFDMAAARGRLGGIEAGVEAMEALCGAAAALGVGSGRAGVLALRVARAAAALGGRGAVAEEDVAFAARVVLAPRATVLPQQEEAGAPEPGEERASEEEGGDGGTMADQVLAAAKAAVPDWVLAGLHGGAVRRAKVGRSGAASRGARGRALAARPGVPRDGARLDLMATLRAAAPWQRSRGGAPPVRIGRDDLRVSRREQRSETVTIFLVDASGSAALHRLAEAKGAVELLLADCYVRRDQVAVLAFRGAGASVVLAPTRSLVRAKRGLAGLPGGGGTPLASGIEAGLGLADAVRRRGAQPTLVLLTDGQANVGRDGKGGRERARAEAEAAARGVRAAGHACLVIDTSPRANPACRALAGLMGGRYLALPHADARAVSRSVRGLA